MLVDIVEQIENHIQKKNVELGSPNPSRPVYLIGHFEVCGTKDGVKLAYEAVLTCKGERMPDSQVSDIWDHISGRLPRLFHDLLDAEELNYERKIGVNEGRLMFGMYEVKISVTGSLEDLQEEIDELEERRGPPFMKRYG